MSWISVSNTNGISNQWRKEGLVNRLDKEDRLKVKENKNTKVFKGNPSYKDKYQINKWNIYIFMFMLSI
jgi:hypothetical protein